MFKLSIMKFFALLYLYANLKAGVITDTYQFTQISSKSYYKKSDKYNFHFLIDFNHTPDHSLIEFKDIYFKPVNYDVKNSTIPPPEDENAFASLNVDSAELKQIVSALDCKTKGISVSDKVSFTKQKNVIQDGNKSIVITYLGTYGLNVMLESVFYEHKLAKLNGLYTNGNFCLIKVESDKQDIAGNGSLIYSDLYGYIELLDSQLQNMIDYAIENQNIGLEDFKPVMTNYYAHKFALGMNGLAVSYLNPWVYIDKKSKNVYPLFLDVQTMFENLKHHDKFITLFNFPFVTYLQYDLDDGSDVTSIAKSISTFHILFTYSYYIDKKESKREEIGSFMVNDPLWIKYVEMWHNYISRYRDSSDKESCLSEFANALIEFIPNIHPEFKDVFAGSNTVYANSKLITPRFSRTDPEINSPVQKLIHDKIGNRIGESWPQTINNKLKDEAVVLTYINYPDNIDYVKMLKNCFAVSIVAIFTLISVY